METGRQSGMPADDAGQGSARVVGDVLEQLSTGLAALVASQAEEYDQSRSNLINDLASAVRILRDSLGECQMAVPYSPMRPVRRPDGTTVWCCNHVPEHC